MTSLGLSILKVRNVKSKGKTGLNILILLSLSSTTGLIYRQVKGHGEVQ